MVMSAPALTSPYEGVPAKPSFVSRTLRTARLLQVETCIGRIETVTSG
jgi:hypothetical protein